MVNICVFCSSSNSVNGVYSLAAMELGILIGERGHTLVYGGSNRGLMGKVAGAVRSMGGEVKGIIPEVFADLALPGDVVVKDMDERLAKMDKLSQAYITLPGGFGTWDEHFRVLSRRQVGEHEKSSVLLNIDGYYDNILRQIERACEDKFTSKEAMNMYFVTESPTSAIQHIENYRPKNIGDKRAI